MLRFIPEINLVCSKNTQLTDVVLRCIAENYPNTLTHRQIYNLTLSYPPHTVKSMTLALERCGVLERRANGFKFTKQVKGYCPRVIAITTDEARILQSLQSLYPITLTALAKSTGISQIKTGEVLERLQGLSLIQCVDSCAPTPLYYPIRSTTHD